MDFKDLEGRTVKISAHTITAKDERGKTCGMVCNVRNYSDIAPSIRLEVFPILKKSGLFGYVESKYIFVDSGRIVWLYPAHCDKFYHEFIEGNPRPWPWDASEYEKRREIEKQAIAAGVLVVHCFY